MEARLIQDIDFTDEDMDRVERETASLLREGLIQRIALREAELATLREERDRLRKAYGDLGEEANSLRAVLREWRIASYGYPDLRRRTDALLEPQPAPVDTGGNQ